jgi:hypothetical protein
MAYENRSVYVVALSNRLRLGFASTTTPAG